MLVRKWLFMRPKELIEKWVSVFNNADAEGLAAMYHQDAINHQVANEPVVGRTAIKQRFKEEFASADMVCIIEQILEDGDWAILEWKDSLEPGGGLRGCGFFQIIEGKIKFQRGYWDKLTFLRQHKLPIPTV